MAGEGGLGQLIDNYVADPVRKLLGVYTPEYNEPELPYYYDPFGEPVLNDDTYVGFKRSTRPKAVPDNLPAYRVDERRGGLETLPQARFDGRSPLKSDVQFWHRSSFDKDGKPEYKASKEIRQMYAYARIAGAAKKLGMPSLTPDQFAVLVLKEGRPDAGFNTFEPKAEADKVFRQRLDMYNIPNWQKNYLGMINYAQRVSEKKKVPFEAVWNGLGTNAYGKSGHDYAKSMEAYRAAIQDPKNAEFRAFVHSAFKDGMKHGLPFTREKDKDTDPFYKSDPQYKYHKRPGKAAGGVVVDDGDPAKRRRLI